MKRYTAYVLFLAILFTVFACKKIEVSNELMNAIKGSASNCEVDLKYAFIKKCKDDEVKKLTETFKITPLPLSIGTASVALNDSDEKIKAVACKLLYREIKDKMNSIKKNPEVISDDVVKNLIKGLSNIKTYIAFYATASTTHLAMLKGLEDQLYEVVDSHPIPQVKYEAYENLMTYGRLTAFKKIQELVNSNPKDKRLVLAALKAPARMYQYSNEEKEEIGGWALQYLNNDDANIALYAGAALNRCDGKYIDAVLDECEKMAKEGKLKPPFSYVLTNYTFTCVKILSHPPNGTKEQCERKKKLISEISK